MKYDFLSNNSLNSIDFKELKCNEPNYFFVDKNEIGRIDYEKGFSVVDLFVKNITGIVSMGDEFAYAENKVELTNRLNSFKNEIISENDLKAKFNLGKNYAEFVLKNKDQLKLEDGKFIKCSYRPFDDRYTYFDNKILWRWRVDTMQHFLRGENIGLALCKQFKTGDHYFHTFISDKIIESSFVSNRTSEITSTFPLYLYPEINEQQTIVQSYVRIPNLNSEIIKELSFCLGSTYTWEKETNNDTFAPLDILDYVYAILHSPTYRKKYKEFLKIDFPRVPYPKDKDVFWQLVKLGGELRQIHLLKSAVFEKPISQYPQTGSNLVGKTIYEDGKVMINETQYFDNVPEVAWNFHIGGYQPAQKYLKDRKDRELQIEDIKHYMKIVVALSETDRLMKEIEKITIL
jgi:predicted helicase